MNTIYSGTRIGLIVGLLLAIACQAPSAGLAQSLKDQGWSEVHEDGFDETLIGDHWRTVAGDWRVEQGRLTGKGQILLEKMVEGSQRIEFEARSSNPGDLSAMLGVGPDGFKSGYFLGFGSDNNSRSKLLVEGRPVEFAEDTITPGVWHKIECYRDGHLIVMRVDGNEVLRHEHAIPLAGKVHNRVGFYLHESGEIDNVRVWSKADTFDPDIAAGIQARNSKAASANLVGNGSFEHPKPGTQTMPELWSVRLDDRRDRIKLVRDQHKAHRGRRYVLLSSPTGPGITLDAIPKDGVQLKPGAEYVIRVWAQALDQTIPTMTVEPGGGTFELGDTWQSYEVSYTHPMDAETQLGCFIRIENGHAAIDDVSFVPADGEASWPDELLADRSGIQDNAFRLDWLESSGGQPWTRRTVLKMTEVMGRDAKGAIVRIKLCDVLPGIRYDRVSASTIKVIDAQSGSLVTFALVESDSYDGPSAMDVLAIKLDCPSRSRSTFYAYYSPERFDPAMPWAAKLPLSLARPSRYTHSLDIDIERTEERLAAEIDLADGAVSASATAYGAERVTAVIYPPDDADPLELAMTNSEQAPSTWAVDGTPLPNGMQPGLWRFEVAAYDGQGNQIASLSKPVVCESAIWWSTNADTVTTDAVVTVDDPGWVQISAARNERESFQIIIASTKGLKNVTLSATDLVHSNSNYVITPDRVDFKHVEPIYVAMPYPHGLQGGIYHDPLVPWRQRDIPAGGQATAWVTISVASDVEPGEYWGDVIASTPEGDELVIPIRLRVFDFKLPDDLAMKAVLGGDIWEKASKGYHPRDGASNPYIDIHDGSTALALAELLAERHATPFYYHHDKSPYAVPWHYDPETGDAEFDFELLDRNVPTMLGWDQDFLFFGGKFAAGWRNPGRVYDWSRDLEHARTAWWEESVPEHVFKRNTPEGHRMYAAYCRGIAEHLESKGWIDNAVLYVTDEDKNDEVRENAKAIAELIHEVNPKLKTLVLSNAEHRYPDYMNHIDLFGGHISKHHLETYEEAGGRWIGTYNSGGFMTTPLSYTRALGVRNWLDGSSGYANWAIWRNPDALIDTSYHTYVAANTGYPARTFVSHTDPSFSSYGTWVYPWPEWEPLPEAGQGQTLFISSVRLEALRESIEDYEYLQMIRRIADRQRPDAHGSTPAGTALQQLRHFVDASRTRIHKFPYFDVDPRQYQSIRERLGEMISTSEAQE